ncbi:Uncharacterised protein [Vibrio cholerae]|nr:Uncharacterised protein [Vibrio cholerae]CSI58970.1 Uncharacterised protein [Vibrio cholerae]
MYTTRNHNHTCCTKLFQLILINQSSIGYRYTQTSDTRI